MERFGYTLRCIDDERPAEIIGQVISTDAAQAVIDLMDYYELDTFEKLILEPCWREKSGIQEFHCEYLDK